MSVQELHAEIHDLTMKLEVSEFLSGEKTKKLTKLEAAIDAVVFSRNDSNDFGLVLLQDMDIAIDALAALRENKS